MYAAAMKCQYCGPSIGLKSTLPTLTAVGLPAASRVKPCGVFIQALADRMPNAPSSETSGIGRPSRKWVRGLNRFQP